MNDVRNVTGFFFFDFSLLSLVSFSHDFFIDLDPDMTEAASHGITERGEEGGQVDLVYLAHAVEIHGVALQAGDEAPDVAEGEAGEVQTPAYSTRQREQD